MDSNPVVRRRAGTILLVLALVAGACTDDADSAATTTSTTLPRPSTVLRIGVEDWPACVNPLTCADPVLREQVLQHVLPVAFERDADDDYRPSPLLAATPQLEETDDGAVIRYEIASRARWVDGRPITSSDFRGTWQAVLSTPGADRSLQSHVVDVDDADPTVAVVTLDSPLVDWQELFGGSSGFVLQADAFGPSTDLTGQFVDELPFAAGPYLLTSWDDAGAVLTATDPWEGSEAATIDQVRLDRVAIDTLDDSMTFDLLIPAAGSAIEAPDGFDVRMTDTTSVLGLWLDQRDPGLQDGEQRRALVRLFDQQALAEAAGLPDPVLCAGWVPDLGPWCEAAAMSPQEADRDAALAALAALGWVPAPDGVLVRGGSELLSIPVSHDPTVPGTTAVAGMVSGALARTGIASTVTERPTAQWRSPARPLTDSTGLGIYVRDLGATPVVEDLYGCPGGLPSSVVGACPDDLVTLARRLTAEDPADGVETVAEIASRVSAEVLWLPIGRLRERSFLRPGRVTPAEASTATGGPLAGLERFEADN